MYILSQILIVISDIIFIVSMLSNKKKNIEFYLALSSILFAGHYLCLSAWTGVSIALVELVFLIVMYLIELNGKTQYNLSVSLATIFITIVLSILTWDSWVSVLPMLAMVIYLIGMIFNNVIVVKFATFVRLILNGVYMLLFKSYFGAGLTVLIILFTIVGIINDYKNKRKVEA